MTSAHHSTTENKATTTQIDALLPQTQCRQCGYPGCKPYAQAIYDNKADINQCPPGGINTIKALAKLLARPSKPLNPEYGTETAPAIAVIDEKVCIGCTLCIRACPVDAILGAAKQMHTVISDECTGCRLCIEPCPVDCIEMQTLDAAALKREADRKPQKADIARQRFEFRQARLAREEQNKNSAKDRLHNTDDKSREATIQATLKRVYAKLNATQQTK